MRDDASGGLRRKPTSRKAVFRWERRVGVVSRRKRRAEKGDLRRKRRAGKGGLRGKRRVREMAYRSI